MENVMDVKNIPIGEIVPYARNAKKHDKRQIDNVAESIRQYGFVQPVVIDRDGVRMMDIDNASVLDKIVDVARTFVGQ